MINIPADNLILDNEEYVLPRPRKSGRSVLFEVTGPDFDTATVTPGFLSSDDTPVFVQDGDPITGPGRFFLKVPKSRYPMLKVTGKAGAVTPILVTVQDVKY